MTEANTVCSKCSHGISRHLDDGECIRCAFTDGICHREKSGYGFGHAH